MKTISDTYFDLERELYNTHDICLINCHFQGLNDGESPLKECCNVHLFNCDFDLRYPLWHDKNVCIESCQFSDKSRAALWYSSEVKILNTKLFGVKAIRECQNIKINDTFSIYK